MIAKKTSIALTVVLMLSITGILPVVGQAGPPATPPTTAEEIAAYPENLIEFLTTADCGTGVTGDPIPWAQILEARCAAGTIDDSGIHQIVAMQNPVMDPGFTFAAETTDGAPDLSYWQGGEYSEPSGGTWSFANGKAHLDNAFIGQAFGANSFGPVQGFDSVSFDVSGGTDTIVGAIVFTNLGGDVYRFTGNLPVNGAERVYFDARSNFVVEKMTGAAIGDVFVADPGTLSESDIDTAAKSTVEYVQIQHNSGTPASFDNVVVDGAAFGFQEAVLPAIEWDERQLFENGLPSGTPGAPVPTFNELGEDGGNFDYDLHDGYAVIVIPVGVVPTLPGEESMGALGYNYMATLARYTPSGMEWVNLQDEGYNAATFRVGTQVLGDDFELELAGDKIVTSELKSFDDPTLGALAPIWAQYYGALGIGAPINGFVFDAADFSADSIDTLALDSLLIQASIAYSPSTYHYYDVPEGDENGLGRDANHLGYFNDAKLLAPHLAVSDALDLLPEPAPGVATLALTAAGAAVVGAGIAQETIETALNLTGCNGICDFNDGWFHKIVPQNAIFNGVEFLMFPDADGKYNFTYEIWYQDSGTGVFERNKWGNDQLLRHGSLGFNDLEQGLDNLLMEDGPVASAQFFSASITEYGQISEDKKTATFAIPAFKLEDRLGSTAELNEIAGHDVLVLAPTAVFGSAMYDIAKKGGSQTRVGWTGTPAECSASSAPWADCPQSGGWMSVVKNAMIDTLSIANVPYTGNLIEAFEYAATPIVGPNAVGGQFMFIDTSDVYDHGGDPVSYLPTITGEGGMAVSTAAQTITDDDLSLWAQVYNNNGEPMLDSEDYVAFYARFSELSELGVPVAHPTVNFGGQNENPLTTDDVLIGVATGDDDFYPRALNEDPAGGMFYLDIPMENIYALSGLAPGESGQFYIYAESGKPGYEGAYSFEKVALAYGGQYLAANAINGLASPIVFTMPNHGVTVELHEDSADQTEIVVSEGNSESEKITFYINNTGDAEDTYGVDVGVTGPFTATGNQATLTIGAGDSQLELLTVSATAAAKDLDEGVLTYAVVGTEAPFGFEQSTASENVTIVAWVDTDGDGARDSEDACPNDVGGIEYTPDNDLDMDGINDVCDLEIIQPKISYEVQAFQQGTYADNGGPDRNQYQNILPLQTAILDGNGMQSAWAVGVVVVEVHTAAGPDGVFGGEEPDDVSTRQAIPCGFTGQMILTHPGSGDSFVVDEESGNLGSYWSGAACSAYDLDETVPSSSMNQRIVDPFQSHGENGAGRGVFLWDHLFGDQTAVADGAEAWILAHPGELTLQAVVDIGGVMYEDTYNIWDILGDSEFAPISDVLGEVESSLTADDGGSDVPTSILIIGDDVTDLDGDGYSNDMEIRKGSGPLNSHSTPYTDDDHDGIPNFMDGVSFMGAQTGITESETGQLMFLDYVKDIQNFVGQDTYLEAGNGDMRVTPYYEDGEFIGNKFELVGGSVNTGVDNYGSMCIGDGPYTNGQFGGCNQHGQYTYSTENGPAVNAPVDGTGTIYDAGLEDGKLWFILQDVTYGDRIFVSMESFQLGDNKVDTRTYARTIDLLDAGILSASPGEVPDPTGEVPPS